MTLKTLICLGALALSSISYAQVLDGSDFPRGPSFETDPLANYWQRWTPKMQKLFQQIRDDDGFVTHYVGAEVGSAYEHEQFKPGKVYYKEEYLGDFYYRYNAYNNEIELRRTQLKEEKQIALIKNGEVSLLDSKGREIRFLTFDTKKKKTKEGYLTLLVAGEKYRLYHRLVVKFTEAKPAANSMVNPIPSKFSHFEEYYISRKTEEDIEEISTKKGKFLKQLEAALRPKTQQFLADNKIDLRQESDLIRTFEFLNTN